MKKKILVALMGVMMSSTVAHAEHKLLVTEILEPKQIEGQAKFEYTHLSGDVSSFADLETERGGRTVNATESVYSLGVGLGHGLEMTAFIPYVFNERVNSELEAGKPELEKRDGVGDFGIEAKYRLLGGEEEPVSVVAGLGLKFDTAGIHNTGTGTTDVSPFIAASVNAGHHYIPYAIYRATIRNHEVYDTHTLSVGLEKELNETFTLDAKIDANFNTTGRLVASTERSNANENYSFELASYVQLAHNFYVIPSVAYVVASNYKTTGDESRNIASADGFRGGISLYYLY